VRTQVNSASSVRVGVDIGGTFTDLVLVNDGVVRAVAKTPTTPDDPSQAVETGLRELLGGLDAAAVEVVHGTTLVSNVLIERKGAKTSLVCTRGFRDVLDIAREQRYDLYDLALRLPPPLVARRHRHEANERILADGTVDMPLSRPEVKRIAALIRDAGFESVAVCFLHAYRYPQHEQAVERMLAEELPGIPISLSSDVAPELGEYARTSTVVANAYVRPLVDRYLGVLEGRIASLGIGGRVYVMLSTGGLATISTARRYPVLLCESGPAAGVLAGAFWGAEAKQRNLLAFDMGGTTAKASLVRDGAPLLTRETEVARMHRFAKGSGLPLRVPVIDLIEIGAGGGSIARVDPFGLPKVGPDSTASEPGPACYGRGGTEPTVTDADLLLGYLNPDYFLGGEMKLDVDAAFAAMARLASKLGLDVLEAAAAVHRVANENMASAARIHATERGLDLRRFTLVATGGAAPVHAWGVAHALGVRSILFPPYAGVASALGMLTATPSFDFVRSLPAPLVDVRWSEVRALLDETATAGRRLLPEELREHASVAVAADVRHSGQGDALTVALGGGLEENPERQVGDSFDKLYTTLYGRRPSGVQLEIVSWRVRVAGPAPAVDAKRNGTVDAKRNGTRRIWSAVHGELIDAAVVDRYALRPGEIVKGPAVAEERESTAVIGVGGIAVLDNADNLYVEIHDHA
jgi:N-methylhydantoinase A